MPIKETVHNQSGLTLIELVVSMALLVLAVLSSTRLINAAARASSEGGRRTQAAILADREIELVRNIRDTNVLTDPDENPWAGFPALSPITPGGKECAAFVVVPGTGGDRVWEASAAITPGSHEPYTADDTYFSEANVEGFSQYRRSVTMCEEGSTNLRRISVEVAWDEGTGPERLVQVETLLTDWDLEQ